MTQSHHESCNRHSPQGLTLIELLVVLVVIGIIATLVLVRFDDAREAAYRDAMMNDLRNYALAQELHRAEHNGYAPSLDELTHFHFSRDVRNDSLDANATGWYLRVAHSKTSEVCSLSGGLGAADATERIACWTGESESGSGDDDDNGPGDDNNPPANSPPVAAFDWTPELPTAGEEVQFRSHSLDPDNDVLTLNWDFDGLGSSNDEEPTFTFNNAGTYQVRLIVSDGLAVDTAENTIEVLEAGGFQLVKIESSTQHACAITQSGDAYCWGYNASGQLGIGETGAPQPSPKRVVGDLKFKDIAVGDSFTCAITLSDEAYCWGSEQQGRLGNGRSEPTGKDFPQSVVDGEGFVSITAGNGHACALQVDGTAFCWGRSDHGQLGNNRGSGDKTTPTPVSGALQFEAIHASGTHTCAISRTDAKAYCWGLDASGQRRVVPTAVEGELSFRSISVGESHVCGVTLDEKTYCWGKNDYGQLGSDTTSISKAPLLVSNEFKAVSAGQRHTCALETASSRAFCWGSNASGQLGIGADEPSDWPYPLPVEGFRPWVFLAPTANTPCAIDENGDGFCWGNNTSGGILGIGETGGVSLVPVQIKAPEPE